MNQDLFEKCETCLQDEPAASTAWCPIHIDVASFAGEMEKGDFKKAFKVLQKRIPFAGMIGMICDHPCEKACIREKVDRSVNISELERSAVYYGYAPFKKSTSISKNNGKIAVIGGGISGITAAFELDKKGFLVTIYEQSDRLGGRIWDYEGKQIDREVIEEELQIIDKLGINVICNKRIGREGLEELAKEYDAVYLGTGEWEGELLIHPETFQVFDQPVFAGGRLYNKNDSVIYAVSTGKRAAVSMERYVKKISLTASREREGSFETPLQYNPDNVESVPRVEKNGAIYSEEEAVNEAKRCLKCRCTECVKACSHMQKFNVTPKSYARQIQINESVIMGTRYANKMINSCTTCGLCGEQCSIGIEMKDIIRETRESMVEKSKMPPSAHDFALRDMEFSNSNRFFMVKPPPPIRDDERQKRERELFTYPRITFSNYAQSIFKGDTPGKENADYLFYPGCQLSASYPEYVEKAYKYLLSNIKEGVGIMLGCCGAPADWAGRKDLMQENIDRFKKIWNETRKPVFILACSSCIRIFDRYLPEIPYVSLWEIIQRYGLPETAKKVQHQILNIHDACATREKNEVHESVRNIAGELGYEIRELKYTKNKTKCCGYGGLVYYANREQAKGFVEDRINETKEDLLVYCAMCKDLFVGGGKRTFHILDLIFGENMEEAARKEMPNLSQRHANRIGLKYKLLRELWGEEPDMDLNKEKELNLVISEDIWKIMEQRLILLEDIQQVITHSRISGERFFNPENSSYLANLRIKYVTYWVRYAERDDGIHILSVYSHRMEVMKE